MYESKKQKKKRECWHCDTVCFYCLSPKSSARINTICGLSLFFTIAGTTTGGLGIGTGGASTTMVLTMAC